MANNVTDTTYNYALPAPTASRLGAANIVSDTTYSYASPRPHQQRVAQGRLRPTNIANGTLYSYASPAPTSSATSGSVTLPPPTNIVSAAAYQDMTYERPPAASPMP